MHTTEVKTNFLILFLVAGKDPTLLYLKAKPNLLLVGSHIKVILLFFGFGGFP